MIPRYEKCIEKRLERMVLNMTRYNAIMNDFILFSNIKIIIIIPLQREKPYLILLVTNQ